jgi:hypothetical protein
VTPTSFTNPWDRVRLLSYFIRFQFTVISGPVSLSRLTASFFPTFAGMATRAPVVARAQETCEDIARVLMTLASGAAMMGVSIGDTLCLNSGAALVVFRYSCFPTRLA